MKDKLIPMNKTVEEVPLYITIKSQSFWWMQIQQQVCSQTILCSVKAVELSNHRQHYMLCVDDAASLLSWRPSLVTLELQDVSQSL